MEKIAVEYYGRNKVKPWSPPFKGRECVKEIGKLFHLPISE